MIRDQNIDWCRKRLYLGPFDLHGLITPADGGATVFAEGAMLVSPTDAGVTLKELGTLGVVGVDFAAAGDIMLGTFRVPYDLDPNWPIGFRVNWAGNQAAAANRGVTWLLLLKAIKAGVAITTATAGLDTVFGESLNTAASVQEWTARGIKNKIGLTKAEIEAGAHLSFSLECDVLDAGTAMLLGLEMDYVPLMTIGGGCLTDRPTLSSGIK